MDIIIDYLKKKGIPVTRENYVALDSLGQNKASDDLGAEKEADLENLKENKEQDNGKNS